MHRIWACLAQLNFTSKAVFLENSFMSDFLGESVWQNSFTNYFMHS